MLKNWRSPLYFVNFRHFLNSKTSLLWQRNLPFDSFSIQINPINLISYYFSCCFATLTVRSNLKRYVSVICLSHIVLLHIVSFTIRYNKRWRTQPVEFFTTYFLQFHKCRLTCSSFLTHHSNFSLALKPIFVLETDLITAYLDTISVPHQKGIATKSAPSRTRNKEQLLTLFAFLLFIWTKLERAIKICVVLI